MKLLSGTSPVHSYFYPLLDKDAVIHTFVIYNSSRQDFQLELFFQSKKNFGPLH
jgi:hypothetical protein